MTWDPITDERIKSLNDNLQLIANDFINYFFDHYKMQIRITCGYRSPEQQHKYFLQGRETSGKIITFADAGQSFHNYGLAFDICKIVNGHANFAIPFSYLKDGALKFGLKWGGDFPFHDYMHFQKNFGHVISWYMNGGTL